MSHDLDVLAEQLSSDNEYEQAMAAETLAALGPDARPAAVALVQAAGHGDARVSEQVVATLEDLGPPTAEQIPPLMKLADSPQPATAYWAITLLGRAGAAAAGAVDKLSQVLMTHDDLAARQRAAWALGKIGPAAASAVPALKQAAESTDARLSRLAYAALDEIGG